MFPCNSEARGKDNNVGIALLGNRIVFDQTLTEYLIEFLLIFASEKNYKQNDGMSFHSDADIRERALPYYVKPRVALRRFIFYDRSKQDSRSAMDTEANKLLKEELIADAEEARDISIVHDLLLSYACITRKRGWYAQALLPVAPELLLPDLQGIKQRQKGFGAKSKNDYVDVGFDFDKHNFLARGGQVYYLHLLQGMAQDAELNRKYRIKLQKLLCNLLTGNSGGISMLANYVQNEWESHVDYSIDTKKFTMGYITDDYMIRAERSLSEITNFLENKLHPVTRIELLANGVVLALLRIMHIIAAHCVNPDADEPIWIIDMRAGNGITNVARLAEASFRSVNETFKTALAQTSMSMDLNDEERFDRIKKANHDVSDTFKHLAKEMKLVIPPRGEHERFSLSEPIVRYLVLALVEPGRKVTLDTFLELLYKHYRMVIGPEQYRKAVAKDGRSGDMANYFEANVRKFQEFLKQCGFLRDLSDATAIVINPYEGLGL